VVGLVRSLRSAAMVLAALVLVPCVVTLVLRQVAVDTRWPVAYVAASPYVLGAAGLALILFVLARAWLGAAVALVTGLVLATTQLPLYVADAAPAADGTRTVVMTANLRFGLADAQAVVDIVRERNVDLLMLQELTPEAQDALRVAGVDEVLPHSTSTPLGGVSGNGLWSHTPLEPLVQPNGFGNPPVAATIELAGHEVFLASIHAVSPFPGDAERWSDELGQLASWLDASDGPAIVAGDLNATFDHRQFRDLLETGLRDAVEQSGSGHVPTFPVGRRYPPLISIDHALTRGPIVATRVDTAELGGTDHLALLAELSIAPSRLATG